MKKTLGSVILVGTVLLTSCGQTTTTTTTTGSTETTTAGATTQSGSFTPTTTGNSGNSGAAGLVAHRNSDAVLTALREEIAPKFQTLTYTDATSGKTLTYHLFTPENYDASKKYPLVLFMPDASWTGKEPSEVLRQGYGSLIFASKESQAKNPAFVLVPSFAGPQATVNDSWEVSEEAELVPFLVKEIIAKNSIDTDRVYTTGQSGGGMLSFYFNLKYPDLFAASMFVGSQWDPNVIAQFADKKFFYIVSAADPKASVGMAQMKEAFEKAGTTYAEAEFSAKLESSEKEKLVQEVLDKKNNHNLIRFTAGTVMPEPTDWKGAEHMYSFDEAYKLETARNWLFAQSK